MNRCSTEVSGDSGSITRTNLPKHVAIIMDGNGRWAAQRNLQRLEGHRMGAQTVRNIVEESRRIGIRYLTLFAFSTENWNRPGAEVSGLMQLFVQYLESEIERLESNGIRLRGMGDIARLPASVQEFLKRNEERTKHLEGMDLILAISYGGRDEIVNAARKVAAQAVVGIIKPDEIDEKLFASNLYLPDVPDPDLLIRTSDECRISNFLLWQLAYAEIVVTPVLWPEFSREHYGACLEEYAGRSRRFGLTQEQIEHGV